MSDKATLEVRNPRSGEIDYRMRVHSGEQVARAARRLRAAQPGWLARGLDGRLAALRQFAAALEEARAPLLDSLSRDTGRWTESVIEIDAVAGILRRWLAEAPALLAPLPARASTQVAKIAIRQLQTPYPLTGVISPWNFPLLLSLIDAIPALVAGSAVLIKPSEVTPRFVPALEAAIARVPALADVLQLVTGAGPTGQALVREVDVVCFTGSVATGRKVGVLAAECFIPAHLELGGKDPAIVCADADLALAARAIAWASMVNAGQSCMSIERCYVAREVHAPFLELLCREVAALRPNWPDIRSGQLGPVIAPAQVAVLEAQLADAYAGGARALTGGALERHGGGTWCQPTVLDGVDESMLVMREESFGPLLPVMAFDDEEQALALANDSRYGLSACVFARDRARAEALAARLEVGAVSINDASLTGLVQDAEKQSFKLSGLGGSRMGRASLARFYRQQALLIGDGAPSPWWFAPA
ncbi:aldehyde dehydrogenase family protein [Massilia oculi]|uniref:Aldehyde dehydrogenase family protein n=1 Tax=Massilia hydrophila TaxID=3044279 RepID=A0ABS7YED2_9BURK|nr:aldehyde dehydrogenase family protein [Massilia oculi]MCA1857347.1 aldehyde dehydrogenase family protein [Massilia oculi]